MSPVLRFAPSTKTGRYTFEPLLKFFMSQFPPFSLPGIVLAASLAIFSH
jgi:lipopolysaccharide export LptBFGC system permease protein LptF